MLRERGIDTILITGTVTNVCCKSTARDGMMLNFKTIMVTDGNAAVTDEDHNASLTSFYQTFGDIMSTDMLISCLQRKRAGDWRLRSKRPRYPPRQRVTTIGRVPPASAGTMTRCEIATAVETESCPSSPDPDHQQSSAPSVRRVSDVATS